MTPEEAKSYQAAYYARNGERRREANRRWKRDNRVKHLEQVQRWQAENRERSNENKKRWKKRHPEKVKAASRRLTPSSLASHAARERIRRKYKTVETDPDIRQVYELAQSGKKIHCYYCRAVTRCGHRHVDHVIPLSRGGQHVRTNLVIACISCNLKKGTRIITLF